MSYLFRLRFPHIISSDSIRHYLREIIPREECPALHVSTYEAGQVIEGDLKWTRKTKQGYQAQCQQVTQRLESMIEGFHKSNTSVIIEGVHLLPSFIISAMTRYNNVIPFLIYISNEHKHRQRFVLRNKYFSLQPTVNKYIQHFDKIRVIQKWLWKRAERRQLPCIDNTNVDRSVAAIHSIILRCMRHVSCYQYTFAFCFTACVSCCADDC